MLIDTIASRVHGLVQASDVRVIWQDGRLYVCHAPDNIQMFECDEPQQSAGSWKAVIGEQVIRFQPPGCGSCARRVMASPIGQMTVDDIVAAVASVQA